MISAFEQAKSVFCREKNHSKCVKFVCVCRCHKERGTH
jgi:hypothetical protein